MPTSVMKKKTVARYLTKAFNIRLFTISYVEKAPEINVFLL
ncbi:hypothetical protein BAZMOX_01797_4 [methanotrophic endosymbiont of Bathymodiolus azoricus (Menez Gwen)]|nr:hypothetical protein BAZMOX_01797_4 [methanotrophic endosymbiont of Bathymodiolus azoricus (Menez Gwen)]